MLEGWSIARKGTRTAMERFDPYAAPIRFRPTVDCGSGRMWRLAYAYSMATWALSLCAGLVLLIRDEDLDGPAPAIMILLMFAAASLLGALIGLVVVAVVHLAARLLMRRGPGHSRPAGGGLGEGP